MSTDAEPSDADLRDALRSYLREHPGAADTLVGISQWWLAGPMQGISLERLRCAVTDLIATGEVRRILLPDETELYSRGANAPPLANDEGNAP
jgi:hypothetical protein